MSAGLIRCSRPIYRLIASSTVSDDPVLNELLGPTDSKTSNILQALTDDRLSGAHGRENGISLADHVTGGRDADTVMAAFLHPSLQGGRFTGTALGAWYAAFDLESAIHDAVGRHTRCLRAAEDLFPATIRLQAVSSTPEMKLCDLQNWSPSPTSDAPSDTHATQRLGEALRREDVDGLLYHEEGDRAGERVVVFRPRVLVPLHKGDHYEIKWDRSGTPSVFTLSDFSENAL